MVNISFKISQDLYLYENVNDIYDHNKTSKNTYKS